jgi:hypothetical protein
VVRGVGPGDDEDGIIGRAFGRPFCKHLQPF